MSTIYLLTVGAYECLTILAAYTEKSEAKAMAAQIETLPYDALGALLTGGRVHTIPLNLPWDGAEGLCTRVNDVWPYAKGNHA